MKNNKINCKLRITRRKFIGAAASVAAFTIVPRHVLGGPGETPPSEKLNIAIIGVGGIGFNHVRNFASENVVALCDVDSKRAAPAFKMHPNAKRHSDFRKMLDRDHKSIDAVVVSTPDHTHVPASMWAMKMGKHVFCEKPLGQNVHEVRMATELAGKTKLATQIGNYVHSGYHYRMAAKMIKDGVIGKVQEVHCWADYRAGEDHYAPRDRPEAKLPVPTHFKWDLWLGPAPVRPYHPCYHPLAWRQWWDFGNGRLGDMGCIMIDLPFTALDLKYPLTVESRSAGPAHKEGASAWLISKWTFPKRGDLPPVELTWYDGNKRPPLQKEHNMPDWPEATIFVGSKGMMIADYWRLKLFPEEKFKDVRALLRSMKLQPLLPHHEEWTEVCKTNDPTRPGTNFGYAGPLTETVLLGAVAYRSGRKLEWDAKNLRATNYRLADQFIRCKSRKGWEI